MNFLLKKRLMEQRNVMKIFDIQYVIPEEYQYSKDNDGQCMLYALLLLLHMDDSELFSLLLNKTKGEKRFVEIVIFI